jgi:UDP-N-acetyl-alpha-D-quinovosamine dehydrogenase
LESILVTGVSGFVGRHLLRVLLRAGYRLTLAHRAGRGPRTTPAPHRSIAIDDIGPKTDWRAALDGCDVVIHLAGQVPRRGATPADFEAVNAAGTGRLVEQARAAGVQRFIYLSSVATVVNNHATSVINEQTPSAPALSAYGESKLEGEFHVAAFGRDGRTAVSILPPIVYGAKAGGTWRTLQRLAASGIPLPFGAIENRRSMIAVENLADALLAVVKVSATKEVSGSYFVTDYGTASVREIFTWLRQGMGMSPRLISVRPSTMRHAFDWIGLGRPIDRLLGDLVIDATLFRTTFDWMPPLETSEAIRRSGAGFRARKR